MHLLLATRLSRRRLAGGMTMTPAPLRISATEQRRRDECVLEPIRTPGSVQSHGVLLGVDAIGWQIISASSNAVDLLGVDALVLLGQPLSDIVGSVAVDQFIDILDGRKGDANPTSVKVGSTTFDVIVHRSGGMILVDFEPSQRAVRSQAVTAIFAAMHRLSVATTEQALRQATVTEFRQLTGYDRVMMYFFHPDEHGEVVAEAAAAGMEPYLGLHYPASDIPAQARELYLSKLSRIIADSSTTPADVLTLETASGLEELTLDLSLAELRAVSPHHLQFMRNMGQASTASFSLVHDGRLIGMITCAHRTSRRLPFAVREGLEILANQVALQLHSMTSVRALTRQLDDRAMRTQLLSGLADDSDLADALLTGGTTIFDLVPADGAAVRIDGIVKTLGLTPSRAELAAFTEALKARKRGLAFITDSFLLDFPELGALLPSITGVLVVPLGGGGDFVAWFRAEQVDAVSWLGDQSAANRDSALSPRNSFSEWTRDVTGISVSWENAEADAAELARDLDSLLFRRAESRLAHVALHDPLTGLPNRRFLEQRLDHALAKYARGEELSLVFIDLDGFKAVNDVLGHDIGDSALVYCADQLRACVRAQDTVARIGGDEFIVLCENTTLEQTELLAQRILVALRFTPMGAVPAPSGLRITASIGVASADQAFSASGFLKLADSAMYRAKQRGGDTISR